ncbi:MAG TPA: hypothetical protein VNJ05_01770 [Sphingomicrobium sp.]|nr:hypothetical protein [Sphingomicrobium sp.]
MIDPPFLFSNVTNGSPAISADQPLRRLGSELTVIARYRQLVEREIETASMAGHRAAVLLRPIFAMLIALGLLLAPFGARTGMAMASPPTDHHEAMAQSHCDGEPDRQQPAEQKSDNCCAAMCTAVAAVPAGAIEPLVLSPSVERPGLDRFRHGFLVKLPTPPPRIA